METIGAAKWLSPEVTLRATKLVTRGKIYRLAQTLATDIPQLADNPAIAHGRRFKVTRPPKSRPGSGALSEMVELPTHTGTHIDAFGHWYKDDRVLGGRGADEVWSTAEGLSDLGIEHCPPLITRGVLFDVAAHKGVEMLDSDVEIGSADLHGFSAKLGVSIQPGEVALVRTGWSQLWHRRDPRYIKEEPGLSREAAQWLAEQGVVAIGADNWAIDAVPPTEPRRRDVHEVCLADRGIYLIENLNLEELAKDRVYEFLFVALPTRLKGGTGFPIEPVAVI